MDLTKGGDTHLIKNILRAGLVVVTGYMTWNFLSTMMGTDGRIVAVLGLLAFEGGMIFWEKYYNDAALSGEQTAISGWMTLVDLAGVALAFIGEVMFNRPDVAFPGWLPQVALMGTTVVVIANVAAFIGISVFDPKRAMDRASRRATMARLSAEVKVQTATAAQLLTDSDQLAVEVAPGRSRSAINDLRRQYAVPTPHTEDNVMAAPNGVQSAPPFVMTATNPPGWTE